MKKLILGLILLVGTFASGVASADHGHWGGHGGGHVGFYFGVPFPFAYPYPYYPYPYYSPVVTVPVESQPPVYIEQAPAPQAAPAAPAAQGSNFWYYCRKPEGYYPYVNACPGGWTPVSPTPPPQK